MNWSWLLPAIKGIPVLMYHKVWPGQNDALSITPEKLREQWTFLKNEGYNTISLQDFISVSGSHRTSYPERSILITFDDGYVNNYTYAYPLLQEFGWQATFFIVADTIDGTAQKEEKEIERKMDTATLQLLAPNVVQLAMHGYHHEHFDQLSLDEIKNVISKSIEVFKDSKLPYCKVLAYPYGARPKDRKTLQNLKEWMHSAGIQAAFRIGNQVSRIPASDMYELKRIDVHGTDSITDLKIKLKKGKLKPF